ncbi:VWA domain-containing protein [Pseudonocardia sichuanensis]|uniref:VWA domain containing CoxE-like protein n=1 Tax=Pseudonocardia kunmingensis TaxID=630975 RepID=A0A543D9M3_9PSEU|nr:VWA domain-containing protein [Pseudonocardia kunmingensis]TQM06006.1 VWA domain containing CoxE-like protein [Pseudonocardia kunmingensis]
MTAHPTAHVIADPDATPAPAADPTWLALSVALTDEVPVIADRDDLLVTIAPGAGRGAPACFLPALATIEVDSAHLGAVDPTTIAPHRIGDRARYGPAWGLLVHECAHAAHSVWENPSGAPPGAVAAATLLEESRIEAAHIRRRPDDRHWLRASATHLILADFAMTPAAVPTPAVVPTPGPAPITVTLTAPAAGHDAGLVGGPGGVAPAPTARAVGGPAMTPGNAGRAAALLLARVDAGILTDDEVAPVTSAVTEVLGEETLATLREIWTAAHATGDDDTGAMIELGRRWCTALGTDPTTDPADPAGTGGGVAGGDGSAADGSGNDGPDGPADDESSVLARAIGDAVARVALMVGNETTPADPADAPTGGAAAEGVSTAEAAARADADAAALRVFGPPGTDDAGSAPCSGTRGRGWSEVIAGTRAPTRAERQAARQVGRLLDTAGIRDRVATRTTSALPPGRLRMRGVLAADAQRAAGAIPTAEPFTRTTRRTVPTPPLRVGVACDVSSSMRGFAKPVASAAWILAHAAAHTRVATTTVTVTFGDEVHAITRPGTAPREVTRFNAPDGYEVIDEAIDALDGALGLSRPGAARLLVIVSDGYFSPAPRIAAQTKVDRLVRAGCGVLWLAPHPTARALHGATMQALADPAASAQAIARAATRALHSTR